MLGALDDDGGVTTIGHRMAHYPLEPKLSRMILEGQELGVGGDVLLLAALLSTENVFYTPAARQQDGKA